MNKAKIIEELQKRITDLSRKQALQTVESFSDIIISELQKGHEVTLAGFGTFSVFTRHARIGVNPRNPQERINIPEVKVAKFKTGKRLKDALKN